MLTIQSELTTRNHKYFVTNSLIKIKNKAQLMKQIGNLYVCYQAGKKDEFSVPIYRKQKNGKYHKAMMDNLDSFNYILYLSQQYGNQLILNDILTIYRHVQKDLIDDKFMMFGIDLLIEKYPQNQQGNINAFYTYLLLIFTSEFYYVSPYNGKPSTLGASIRLVSIFNLILDKQTPKVAANWTRGMNRHKIKHYYQQAVLRVRELGFQI